MKPCIEPIFYTSRMPGSSFEESRSILIAKYLERELEPQSEKAMKLHLEQCASCFQFLKELESIGTPRDSIPSASCPSSHILDAYVFDVAQLPTTEKLSVEKHLEECPFCKEETEWHKRTHSGNAISFSYAPGNWGRYLSVVAAVFITVIATALFFQDTRSKLPEDELHALAAVKEPNHIDFAELDQACDPLPFDVDSVYGQALRLFKGRDFKEASVRFEQVLTASPDHSASVYLLGYCYYKLQEMEKAFSLCEKAEKMEPKTYERCMSLVHIALKTGHYDRAIIEIASLYHEAPDDPQIQTLYKRIIALTQGRKLKL